MEVCKSFKHSITWGKTKSAGVIYGAVLEDSLYIFFVQEWNPGSGSFPDLFENLGKSYIMSVF